MLPNLASRKRQTVHTRTTIRMSRPLIKSCPPSGDWEIKKVLTVGQTREASQFRKVHSVFPTPATIKSIAYLNRSSRPMIAR